MPTEVTPQEVIDWTEFANQFKGVCPGCGHVWRKSKLVHATGCRYAEWFIEVTREDDE
jgi:hypothetical protein